MKELILKAKNNQKILLLLVGIFLVTFNRVFFISYPDFFLGKFNFFQTKSILIAEPIIIIGCIYYLVFSKSKKITIWDTASIAFFIWLFIRTREIHYATASILCFTVFQMTTKEIKNCRDSLIVSTILQTILAASQFIFQTNLNLQALGEAKISHETKGIAKIRLPNSDILRAYGTLAHPNVLAAYIGFNSLSSKPKIQNALKIGLLSTLSITGSLSTFIATITKKILIPIIISAVIFTTIIGIRSLDTNFESVSERVEQTENVRNTNRTLRTILFGSANIEINTAVKQAPWQISPTHNSYIYSFEKGGIIALALLLLLLINLYKKNFATFIFVTIFMVADHFWLSLGQGTILLALILTTVGKTENSLEQNHAHS